MKDTKNTENAKKLIQREISLLLASLSLFFRIANFKFLLLFFFSFVVIRECFEFLFKTPVSEIYWYNWLLLLIGIGVGVFFSFAGTISGAVNLNGKNRNSDAKDAGDNVGIIYLLLLTLFSIYSEPNYSLISPVSGLYTIPLMTVVAVPFVVSNNITFFGRGLIIFSLFYQSYKVFVSRDFVIETALHNIEQGYGPAAAIARDWWLKYIVIACPVALFVASIYSTYINFKYIKRDISGRWEEEVRLNNEAYFAANEKQLKEQEVREKATAQNNNPDYPLTVRDSQAVKPRLTFKDLEGNDELKKKLLSAANEWNRGKGGQNGIKNGIFLYGPPGTGKTAFAEALAGELGLKIIKSNVSSIASRFVNQTTEQLVALVDEALRQAPCVLFLDEADSILVRRSGIERSDSEENKVVTTFLTLAQDKLHDSGVLLVTATNFKDRVDDAAMREGRFDYRIEVPYPDAPARKGLVLGVLKKAGKEVNDGVLERLVKRWAGFNVKRIQEATLRACSFSATKEVGMKDFMRGLRDVQGNKTGAGESALSLKDLYFDDELKSRLEQLAVTFSRSDEVEMRGGQVPRGIIFYGPPGTGKTAMAQALAKEAEMTFIPTSGKAILSDDKALNEICRKASDLRPAIIFIDEGDDILGDRNAASVGMKLHTNDLLARISGSGDPLPDVVWMLATNSIDSMDEAVDRRFPIKIELPVPGLKAITAMIANWAKPIDNIAGIKDEWVIEVAQFLEGLSPSVIKTILESAKNHAAVQGMMKNAEIGITVGMVHQARKEMRA